MREEDIIKNLEQLKNVKPNEDWASSARADLLAHIETSEKELLPTTHYSLPTKSFFEKTLAQPKWAAAFTVLIFVFMAGSAMLAQNSQEGDLFYPIKVASDDLRNRVNFGEVESDALYAQKLEEVEQRSVGVVKIASTKLEADEAEAVASALENDKREIEMAAEGGNEEEIERELAEANEKVEAWTNILSTENPREELEERITVLYEACEDEKLKEDADELLENGDWLDMVEAFESLNRCDPVQDDPEGQADGANGSQNDPVSNGAGSEGETVEN